MKKYNSVKSLCRLRQNIFAATGKAFLPEAAKHLCRNRQNTFAATGKEPLASEVMINGE
ncbi:MAG: hypothetical protein LBL42_05725 [Tannerella sp.]|nr:hypothetical protein [Tannerella sp.]